MTAALPWNEHSSWGCSTVQRKRLLTSPIDDPLWIMTLDCCHARLMAHYPFTTAPSQVQP